MSTHGPEQKRPEKEVESKKDKNEEKIEKITGILMLNYLSLSAAP